LFGHRRIDELPFVDFDGSYDPTEWTSETPHTLFAMRLLLTHFRPWPAANPTVSDSALTRLNTELFKAFIKRARENGSVPLIVPFPSHTELARGDVGPSRAEELLRAANIEYIDVGGCVRGVDPSVRLVRTHYSRQTNAAVARCLHDALGARHLLP
jgi:hypothetical protein